MYKIVVGFGSYFAQEVPLGTIDKLEHGMNRFINFLDGVSSEGKTPIRALVFDNKGNKVRQYWAVNKEVTYKDYEIK